MSTRWTLLHLFWSGLLTISIGCSGLQESEQKWQPYRSPMLNHDYSSAYPRSASADPFGVASGQDDRAVASSDSQVALAEPERDRVDSATEAPQSSRPQGDQGSSAYHPEEAAAYVATVYSANETPTTDSERGSATIVDIYRHTQREGTIYHSTRPAVGDLVFFHNTYDRNGDGRNNDWYTHVGLVESVSDDGDISLLSYLDGSVSRTHLNLDRPDESHDDSGDVVNTVMRRRAEDDPPYTQYLASELFAGFGSLLGDRTEFLVIDNWQPGMDVAAVEQQ